MINMQEQFEREMNLIVQHQATNKIIVELLNHVFTSEVCYSNGIVIKPKNSNKEYVLGIYEVRGQIEEDRKDNPFVIGYNELLPNLRKTLHEYIDITHITSEKGSYVIFTDYDKTDFIGILKTNRTLAEVRAVTQYNKEQHNLKDDEVVFINGRLK